jgi:hypothetical protein
MQLMMDQHRMAKAVPMAVLCILLMVIALISRDRRIVVGSAAHSARQSHRILHAQSQKQNKKEEKRIMDDSDDEEEQLKHQRRLAVDMSLYLNAYETPPYRMFSNSSNPKKVNGTRIAICVSGQLRSGNLTWTSGHIHQNAGARMFGDGDPATPVKTIIENMFKPLINLNHTIEGVDVFMYITAHPGQPNSTFWDGDPFNFEPSPGDTTVCNPFSNDPFFHGTGNKIFCLVEEEKQLITPILENNLYIWKSYTYRFTRGAKEQVLQQYYGMYRANLMAKQYALYTNTVYSHKIRVRPDTAVVKPFPPLSALDFGPKAGCPNGQIWYANKVIFKTGNEDWFNIGTTQNMDHLLDRYVDFISLSHVANWRGKDHWDLEDNAIGVMERYGVCMNWYYDIWMVVIRKEHHGFNTWVPPVEINQWKELST